MKVKRTGESLVSRAGAYNCINCGAILDGFIREDTGLVVSKCNTCGHKNKFLPNGVRK
ncbi:hypothetical protein [Candidatus Oleimmundimicrobium sp.]|uniref:hypothetical protein n=1 Tax=Candidatus Oleimmundimicrobium sp. TaxID=3060597 RepID=UPI0027229AE7|nr:hypothetical protein [Candidatus Oleimmundimicrobium sp.]MDO8885541.1 hypothetical protein [Candidatus Oleimmundimicrobium sp.]